MLKLIVAVFALMAVASAFPSGVEQTIEGGQPQNVVVAVQPKSESVAVTGESNKENLENAETFGFGYYRYYPRYYYGGYHGYGYYPRYYYGYPRYYW